MTALLSTLLYAIGYLCLGIATTLWLFHRAARYNGNSDPYDSCLFRYLTLLAFIASLFFLALALSLGPNPNGLAAILQMVVPW